MRFAAFLAATTITIIGLQTVGSPEPARAENQDTDFTLTVFPVNSDEVRFRDSWGEPRSGGRRHKGTDIVAERGSEILAVADGVVSEMDYHYLSGYYITIDHGDGVETMYLHLNNDIDGTDNGKGGTVTAYFPTMVLGKEVKAGDVIAYLGDSGNAEHTTPNTHFEIIIDGDKIDPYPLLEKALELGEHNLPPLVTPRDLAPRPWRTHHRTSAQ
jgi:murein DD-endopeptidase MepM/ murein hydrolase activator NlpD